MTSLCNPAKSTQPLQDLMIDCLVDYPNNQCQENKKDTHNGSSNSAYWAQDLSVSGSSSAFSRYHTALAFGATVVCSAGALMQHTETGFWHSPNTGVSVSENTISLERSDSADQVLTPPIAGPQTSASFSLVADGTNKSSVADGTNSDGTDSNCKDSDCKGLAFIEQRLPEIQEQVRTLRAEMQQFQTQHTAQNLQTHRSVLSYRSSDVVRRQAELEVRSQQLTQQFTSLTSALALQPDEAHYIANLLKTDTTYQASLQQLQALERNLAVEYSNPDLDNSQLEGLYSEYAQGAEQLRQIAQTVLVKYISAASVESPDPLWQEDSYQTLLQELMDLSHLRQMLVVEQNTLAQMEEQLTQRRTELAVLLKQYAVMQQQLEGQNKILQQYIAKRQEIKKNLT
ncbi:hypothetical protein IQ260_03520 [Leptolyngbya cf. ectocarpi LEGE 11479]|uniref:Uncharacterized protein n=1 Tax=Leptolyngbya cf. ectocarpi LEGE 11479 TaxID=1828722 RepID=A0A928WZI6_LEPEC|nr:hypothetical protein [Leptolyngbya ectocarpi]MBE9065717.1 hypothetical protein [Leptolyngbya cf. ectocarpi LEGE 11479]